MYRCSLVALCVAGSIATASEPPVAVIRIELVDKRQPAVAVPVFPQVEPPTATLAPARPLTRTTTTVVEEIAPPAVSYAPRVAYSAVSYAPIATYAPIPLTLSGVTKERVKSRTVSTSNYTTVCDAYGCRSVPVSGGTRLGGLFRWR